MQKKTSRTKTEKKGKYEKQKEELPGRISIARLQNPNQSVSHIHCSTKISLELQSEMHFRGKKPNTSSMHKYSSSSRGGQHEMIRNNLRIH